MINTDAEKIVSKNGTSFISVSVASNYSFAAAYCAKKEMGFVALETEVELDLISSIVKGKYIFTSVTSKLKLPFRNICWRNLDEWNN